MPDNGRLYDLPGGNYKLFVHQGGAEVLTSRPLTSCSAGSDLIRTKTVPADLLIEVLEGIRRSLPGEIERSVRIAIEAGELDEDTDCMSGLEAKAGDLEWLLSR